MNRCGTVIHHAPTMGPAARPHTPGRATSRARRGRALSSRGSLPDGTTRTESG